MKYNGYNIVSLLLEDEDLSSSIDPLELTSAAADKVIYAAEKFPRKKFGNWAIQHTAKAIKHFADKKKEDEEGDENKLKGV